MPDVPRTLIGGTPPTLKEPIVSFSIDWISCSYKVVSAGRLLPNFLALADDERIQPRRGYNRACPVIPAGRFDWHTDRESQGRGLEVRGNDLKTLRAAGIKDEDWLIYLTSKNCKVTRFDYAIDVKETAAHPADIREALRAKIAHTKARQMTYIEQDTEPYGATLYLGTRKSDRMIRIYDKQAESGGATPWTRIEIVLRKKYAGNALRHAEKVGLPKAMSAQIADMLSARNVRWFDAAVLQLEEGAAQPDRTKPDEERYHRWLKETIFPGIAKRVLEDDRTDIFADLLAFTEHLKGEYAFKQENMYNG